MSVLDHNAANIFPIKPGDPRPQTNIMNIGLPTQGRLEREHLYLWIIGEEGYVAGKFDDQRNGHDDSMRETHVSRNGFWFRQITQYYDRARLAFEGAYDLRTTAEAMHPVTNTDVYAKRQKMLKEARTLEMKGQQALAKAMMTAKGAVESSIRVFGPMPKPGLSSGYVEEWT